MPIAGFVKRRKHQFGRQTVLGTKVAATRAYPFSGTPDSNLNWTDPEIDAGSIDLVAPPYRTANDLTANLSAPVLNYNDLPLLLSAMFGDGVTPTGATSKTWVYEPASLTTDVLDLFTYQFGDDVLTDWFQFGDGLLESLEISGPEGLGPLSASGTWRFASIASTGSTDSPVTGTVPTAGLSVDTAAIPVFLKDGGLFIASTVAGLAAGQVTGALHSFTLRVSGDIDQKRFADATQSFDVQDFGRATRLFELECVFAKTADTVGTGSESDSWMSDTAVNRLARLTFTSLSEAAAGIPYSWTSTLPLRYYTRTEGESGGNSTVVLTGRGFYMPTDFTGVFKSTVINTLSTL